MILVISGLMALIIIGSALLYCIHEIGLEPVAIIKRRFGKIVEVIVEKRWVIILPKIHSYEEIPVGQFLIENIVEVTTPDNVSSKVKLTLAVKPIPEKEPILKYLVAGKKDGVTKILKEIAEQETRQWARTEGHKPLNWEELQSSQDELVAKLKDKLIRACNDEGGYDNENLLKANHWRLGKYGLYLEEVAIGQITIDAGIAAEKDKVAKERLQADAELKDIHTKITLTKEVAKLSKEEIEAFQLVKELDILEEGKTGGIYHFNFRGLETAIAGALKKIFSDLKGTQ